LHARNDPPKTFRSPDLSAFLTICLGNCIDLALFKVRENQQHMAFLTDYENTLGMVHSYAPARRVVEHRLVKAFRWT
jgi:hypothetical protein